MSIDIPGLKAKQDRLEARKSKLLECFHVFRDGFFEGIEQFTREAINAGIRDVKALKKESTPEMVKATVTLNGFNMMLIANDDVFCSTMGSQALAAKIFMYRDTKDPDVDVEPMAEIVVAESDGESHAYMAQWFSSKGSEPITQGAKVDFETGQKVAASVIEKYYSFRIIWKERPTRGVMLAGGKDTSAPGFL